jgi:N-acetylglutamate synthase-like GNAT family acetyltransferase
MTEDESKKSLLEQYAELAKNSLVKVQYSCGGNSTGIDEPEYIPIVDEMQRKIAGIKYLVATSTQTSAIVELLKANNLPITDLNTGERIFFVAVSDENIIGCVAVETYEDSGLLRSLAVADDFKGKGIGRKLLSEAESWAKSNNLKSLYLLTTTASEFFQQLGWIIVERSAAPDSIKNSSEFASVCPSTAVCLSKAND